MTEEIKKKGMSKGCLVALIVVGVLFVMAVIAGVTCWAKKDELVKYGVKTAVIQVGGLVTENPQAGVDTARVNAVVTAFTGKLDADTSLNLEALGTTIQKIQYLPQDEVIDSAEAIDFIKILSEIYPELMDIGATPMEEMLPDTTVVDDSAASE